MCGLAGFVTSDLGFNHQECLQRMATSIAHRGPDDEGFLEQISSNGEFKICLAHRRLSIIDLAAGHQPMTNEDESVHIVFNGEIYNYKKLRNELIELGHVFRTNSDTETIIHAYEQWGTSCVNKFNGMFAFAIWDAKNELVFVARDRFGKKPLYYLKLEDSFVFASEIKAILEYKSVDAKLNESSLWDYYTYRYVPSPRTLFDGIQKLMPGSFAVFKKGNLSFQKYYSPPDRLCRVGGSEGCDPVNEFLIKLDRAVEVRMVSDVPFGAFLSGGLDSSAIVGLMSRHSNLPVKTFSVGFEETNYSELKYAKIVANEFGTEHHELLVSSSHLMEYLPELIRFRDAPISEPSDIPIYLLAKEAAREVKMVLTGEGADEFLGGYPKHVYERYVKYYKYIPSFVRHGLIEPAVHSLPYRFHRAKIAVSNFAIDDPRLRLPKWFGALSDTEKRQLLICDSFDVGDGAIAGQFDTQDGNSVLRNILFFDQVSWLPDNLLERGDSMTMAASIEARMPFMDYELVAFVSSLADDWRVRGHATKYILREAVKKLLPSSILGRSKIGLRVPVNEWFCGSMKDYLYDHLLGSDSKTLRFYRKPALEKLLSDHVRRRQNNEKVLWALLNLELWHRQYV